MTTLSEFYQQWSIARRDVDSIGLLTDLGLADATSRRSRPQVEHKLARDATLTISLDAEQGTAELVERVTLSGTERADMIAPERDYHRDAALALIGALHPNMPLDDRVQLLSGLIQRPDRTVRVDDMRWALGGSEIEPGVGVGSITAVRAS